MLAQQPDEVLHQLIVHARSAEFSQIENDAQTICYLLEALLACLLQIADNKTRQLINVTCRRMILGRNIDNRAANAVAMPQHPCLVLKVAPIQIPQLGHTI